MKKVLLFDRNGVFKSATIVKAVAVANGITVKQVPALIAAWYQMGAVRPRIGGGFYVYKHVPAGDRTALRLLAEAPHAKPPTR